MARTKQEPTKRRSEENTNESFHDPEDVRRLERELKFIRRQKAQQIRMMDERDGRRRRDPTIDSDEEVDTEGVLFEPRQSTRTLEKELDKAQQRFMFNVGQMEEKFAERERRGHPESLIEMDLHGNFFYPESMAGCHQQAFINRMFRHEAQFGKGHISAPRNSIDSFDGDLKALKKCQQLDKKFGRSLRRSEEFDRARNRRDRSSERDITLRTESTASRFTGRYSEDFEDDVFGSEDRRDERRVMEKKDARRHPTVSTMASFFEEEDEENEENEFGDDEEESEEDGEESSGDSEEDLEKETTPNRAKRDSKESTPNLGLSKKTSPPIENRRQVKLEAASPKTISGSLSSSRAIKKERGEVENVPVITLSDHPTTMRDRKITDFLKPRQPFKKASSEPPKRSEDLVQTTIVVPKQEARSDPVNAKIALIQKNETFQPEEKYSTPKEPSDPAESSDVKSELKPSDAVSEPNETERNAPKADSKPIDTAESVSKTAEPIQSPSPASGLKKNPPVQETTNHENIVARKQKATPKKPPKSSLPKQTLPSEAAETTPKVSVAPKEAVVLDESGPSTSVVVVENPKKTEKIQDLSPSTSGKPVRVKKPTMKAAAALETEQQTGSDISHCHSHEGSKKKGKKRGRAKSPFCKHCEYIKEQKKQAKIDAKNGVKPEGSEDQKRLMEAKKVENALKEKKETPKGKRVSKNTKSPQEAASGSGTKRRSVTVVAEEPEMKKKKLTDSDIISIPSSLAVVVDTELIAAENPTLSAANLPKFSDNDTSESSIWKRPIDSKWINDVEKAAKKAKNILGSPISEIPKNTQMITVWVNSLLPGNMEKDPFESDYRRVLAQNRKALSDGKAGYEVRQ